MMRVDTAISVLLFFVVLVGGRYLGILIHELGHTLTGSLCGWKALEIKVGRGRPFASFSLGDLRFQWGNFPETGYAKIYPHEMAYFRLKGIAVYLGGPLFNIGFALALCAILGSLPANPPSWLFTSLLILLLTEALSILGSLFPMEWSIDRQLWANDMLLVWRMATLKKEHIWAAFCAYKAAEAGIYLERGEKARACALLDDLPVDNVGASADSAKTLVLAMLLSENRVEEAERLKASWLDREEVGSPSHIDLLDGLACIPLYYGVGDLAESLAHIEEAIDHAPETITLKGTKGSLLIEMGRVEEGMELLEEVAAVSQSEMDRAIAHFYKALAVLKTGDRTMARHLLEEGGRKYPQCVVRSRIEKIFWNDPV